MTESKPKHVRKGWIIAAAAVLVLLCALFTANAATDGAVFDGRLLRGLRLVMDGKEFRLSDYQIDVYTVTDENGDTVVRHEYALPNGAEIYADTAEDHTAFSMDADTAEHVEIRGENTNEPASP